MNLLLDSHVFLWWKSGDPKLGGDAAGVIARAPEVYVSAATAWELGLKVALGKLRLPESVENGVRAAGFRELPVVFRHTRAAVELPPTTRIRSTGCSSPRRASRGSPS